MRRLGWVCLALVLGSAAGRSASAAQDPARPRLTDATAAVGLSFVHDRGSGGERYMIETMGSGVSFADLDADGRLDLYLVQGAATPGYVADRPLRDELLRGSPSGRFTPTPVEGSTAYGMGATAADVDNDGYLDLYVTNFGANQLFRNNGDGTFAETGAAAGVADPLWSTSAAFGDVDNDGDLDLYVANYVDFRYDNHKYCGNPRRNLRAYCHPDVYAALPDSLYRNDGDGTFTTIGEAAGIADRRDGKGLGAVFGDYDDDGDPDVYVANDSTRNFLYTNVDGSRFVDDGLLAGVGYSENGQAEAGMGTDWGDYDGDGHLDVVVTNLDLETNTLYRNLGGGVFADTTFASGMGEPSLLSVGFGTNWLDIDNDADLDLFVANGHIIDNIEDFRDNVTYAQANHLYVNGGDGRFTEASADWGPGMALVRVSRGSAVGDADNDGDLDVVVTNNGQAADFLRNDGGHLAGGWIQLRLVGRRSNRSAAGARVILRLPGAHEPLLREVRAGSSYCSSGDPRMHVGLGSATSAEIVVRWPGGDLESLGELGARRAYVVQEGRGVIAAR